MSKLSRLPKALVIASILSLVTLPAISQTLTPPPSFQQIWVQDFQPFRLAGNLYYVGSYDLACYLITTPAGNILINTGVPGSDTMIRKHIETLGFKFKDIRILLTNQGHFDHVGGMAAIKSATKAKLMLDSEDEPVLADGGNSDFTFGGKGPLFIPVKADRLLHDRDTIKLGGMEILVLHHPGHTKGSCSYLFTVKDETRSYKVLIANIPSILSTTKFPSMPGYQKVMKDYAYTLDVMPKLQFDLWFAAHAGQFDLHKKHQPNDPYNPMVFSDRAGYDSALSDQQKSFAEHASEAAH